MLEQLLAHLWGDYLLQSDWMAQNKTKDSIAAFIHALLYSLCFLPLILHDHSWKAWDVIFTTHFFIDRYRLARYVVWAKNWLAPRVKWWHYKFPDCEVMVPIWKQLDRSIANRTDFTYSTRRGRTEPWEYCAATGYSKDAPAWMAVWLLIIADNTIHLTLNYLALKYL